eukprot:TRINITY_DN477_c1_g1_i1.p1 TRINITY_DN477_c1_g1~~TRINITY_DN477_c1_g1_i1.p1  ORF type:complete len:255 (+),score=70.68 TRINITY_DN477_c1_g1_i1:57-767(+)
MMKAALLCAVLSLAPAQATPEQGLVNVDVMLATQCPDAESCVMWFLPQVIKEVGSIMNLTIGMIAEEDNTTKTGFACMHGDGECVADITQLCVKEKLQKPAYLWMQYVKCASQNVKLVPQISRPCLETMNISANVINDIFTCADGQEGRNLMTANVRYTIGQCGHWHQDPAAGCRSCTMYLEGQLGCIHDIGRAGYYNCPTGNTARAWIDSICQAYKYGKYYGQDFGNELPPACFL